MSYKLNKKALANSFGFSRKELVLHKCVFSVFDNIRRFKKTK